MHADAAHHFRVDEQQFAVLVVERRHNLVVVEDFVGRVGEGDIHIVVIFFVRLKVDFRFRRELFVLLAVIDRPDGELAVRNFGGVQRVVVDVFADIRVFAGFKVHFIGCGAHIVFGQDDIALRVRSDDIPLIINVTGSIARVLHLREEEAAAVVLHVDEALFHHGDFRFRGSLFRESRRHQERRTEHQEHCDKAFHDFILHPY